MPIDPAHPQATPPPSIPRRTARALINTLLTTLGFAAMIIVPARSWTWPRGWTLIAVFFVIHIFGTLRILRANPGLLRERARLRHQPGQPIAERLVRRAFLISYVGLLIISSRDATRWHFWPPPPPLVAWTGQFLCAAGSVLVFRALETNAFAIRVVRHQPERGHHVVDVGVYRIVRHPMYSGLCAIMLGIPLWLGSTLGLLCAIAPIAMLALRIQVEERLLRDSVPGYLAYTQRVRSRLIPGIW